VGSLIRLEVSAIVVEVDGTDVVDLTLLVHLPVVVDGAAMPPDWPGPAPSHPPRRAGDGPRQGRSRAGPSDDRGSTWRVAPD
jgi:hypothetical protein